MNKVLSVLLLSVFALTACNTVKGVARDVKSGANAVEKAVDDVSD